jgi:hypothetical protein
MKNRLTYFRQISYAEVTLKFESKSKYLSKPENNGHVTQMRFYKHLQLKVAEAKFLFQEKL